MRSLLKPTAAAFLATCLLFASACTDDDTPEDTATTTTSVAGDKPTAAQSQLLARTLFQNHELAGATVEVTVTDETDTITFDMEVDFVEHSGSGEITTTLAVDDPSNYTRFAYYEGSLFEFVPGLADQISEDGGESPSDWIERSFEQSIVADLVIQLVQGLSTDDEDNPVLIQSQGDIGVLGTDTFDGVEVTKFNIGDRIEIWVDADGIMKRTIATITGFAPKIDVRIVEHGERDIELPDSNDLGAVAASYTALTGITVTTAPPIDETFDTTEEDPAADDAEPAASPAPDAAAG